MLHKLEIFLSYICKNVLELLKIYLKKGSRKNVTNLMVASMNSDKLNEIKLRENIGSNPEAVVYFKIK